MRGGGISLFLCLFFKVSRSVLRMGSKWTLTAREKVSDPLLAKPSRRFRDPSQSSNESAMGGNMSCVPAKVATETTGWR